MALVLDTHVWIWMVEGVRRLGRGTVARIEAEAREGAVYIPAIGLWEVAMLVKRRRVSLSLPVEQWLDLALAQPGFVLSPLSPRIVAESTELPGGFSLDPADNLIIATARTLPATLVTHDERIFRYASEGHVSVLGKAD